MISTAVLGLTLQASATTITGNYTVSIGPGSDATLTDNLATVGFSINTSSGSPYTTYTFITANPQTCWTCIGHTETGTINVTFSNLKVNGTSIAGSYSESGAYSATYTSASDGIDSIDWTGAVAKTGFGTEQDGSTPLVDTLAMNPDGSNTLDIYLVDGADWDVQTKIAAAVVDPTPLPAALPLFATGLGGLGLFGWRRKRKNGAAIAA